MTRRAQYVDRKRRMLFRSDRDHQGGWRGITGPTPTGKFGWRQTSRKFQIVKGAKLKCYKYSPWRPVAQPITDPWDPYFHWTLPPHDSNNPPHPEFDGLFGVLRAIAPQNHQRYQIIGYHNRPIARRPHKKGRMTGWERRAWGAATFVFKQGYWPDWDPLQRAPTFADILDGAPPYAGPFPQTPRGGIVK